MKRHIFRMVLVLVAVVIPSITTAQNDSKQQEEIRAKMENLQHRLDSLKAEESEKKSNKRFAELEGYLQIFGIDSLRLGEPVVVIRCPCEQFGIYLKRSHVGDIYAEMEKFNFSKYGFLDAVLKILRGAGIVPSTFRIPGNKEQKVGFEIEIQPEADSTLKAWGGGIYGDRVDYGNSKDVLALDSNTKNAKIYLAGDVIVVSVINHDGSKTIATIMKGRLVSIGDLPADSAK